MIKVYDYYQLMTDSSGKFTKTQKQLIRKGVKINPKYADEINQNSSQSGKMYIFNEKATKKFQEATKTITNKK